MTPTVKIEWNGPGRYWLAAGSVVQGLAWYSRGVALGECHNETDLRQVVSRVVSELGPESLPTWGDGVVATRRN